jgi:hypothetical protein
MEANYDRRHPYPIVLLRRAEESHRVEAIVAMLRRCGELEPPVVFTHHRASDMTWRIEEITEEWLRKTFAMVEDPVESSLGLLAVMTEHDEPVKLMVQRQLRWRPYRYEIVNIDVPWAPKVDDRPLLIKREQLFTLMRETAASFDADIGAIYPRSLYALVRLASGSQARQAGPVGTGDNGSPKGRAGAIPAFIAQLPERLFERFATLRPTRTFDAAAVPESVWWANVWSARVIERIGRERVEAQPWARMEPCGDGGLFLQATRQRPGPGKPEALEHIAQLNEGLGLADLQRSDGDD